MEMRLNENENGKIRIDKVTSPTFAKRSILGPHYLLVYRYDIGEINYADDFHRP